jgi:hypothetical protein
MLSHISISERTKISAQTCVRTCVISPMPLREMAHSNKEDALRQNATSRFQDLNLFISWNLQSALKKFTTPLTAASGLHLYQRRLS